MTAPITSREALLAKGQPFTISDLTIGEQIVRELYGLTGYDAWAEHLAKMVAAVREGASDAQQPTWRPIETAPKDGSICDLLLVGGGRVTDQWWDNDSKSWCGLGNDMFSHWMAAPYPIYTASSTMRVSPSHALAEDCVCDEEERRTCPVCR